jgi:DNA ligase-1
MFYTNTPDGVLKLVEAIAATSSKKEKEALVKQGMGLPLFAKVVIAAYDRFKNYGFGDVPNKTPGLAPGANSLAEPFAWALLSGLADGTISGNLAREQVQKMVNLLDESSSTLFRRILLKDMRAGFTEGTVNRVAPGTFPEYPYMRCSLPDKSDFASWPWEQGMISQEKADGSFVNVNKSKAGVISMTTRQGTPYPLGCMWALEAELERVLNVDTQTHGELLVFLNGELLPREQSNGVLNRLASGGELEAGEEVRFYAWDQIPLAAVQAKGKHEVPYKTRLALLLKQFAAAGLTAKNGLARVIDTRIVRSKAEAMQHCAEMLQQGKEGTICKLPTAIWKDGTSKEQVKLKLEVDVDLVAVEIVPGKPDTKNEGRPGSIKMRTSCGGLEVDVTVKNEAMRDAIEKDPESFLKRIYAVRANLVLKPSESNPLHSLFLPRLVEATFRTDKTVADSLEQVIAQFDAAAGVKREAVPA